MVGSSSSGEIGAGSDRRAIYAAQLAASDCCVATARESFSWPRQRRQGPRGRTPLRTFAAIIARGLSAVREEDGTWRYDVRHDPPRGRLPLTLHICITPSPIDGQTLCPVNLIEAPQLCLDNYSRHARPALVFVKESLLPTLPYNIVSDGCRTNATDEPLNDALFWQCVCTDSCEAAHCGEVHSEVASDAPMVDVTDMPRANISKFSASLVVLLIG